MDIYIRPFDREGYIPWGENTKVHHRVVDKKSEDQISKRLAFFSGHIP